MFVLEYQATVPVTAAAMPNAKTAIAGTKIFVFFMCNFPFE
jgi:hypothetical protein